MPINPLNNLSQNAGDIWFVGAALGCIALMSYIVWSLFFVPLTRGQEHSDVPKGQEKVHLPGWTMVVNVVAMVAALTVLGSCKYVGLSWWIGVPVAAAIIVVELLWERAIERKYCLQQLQTGR
ncbi:hypothetical protein ACUXPM_003599 [Ralstonia sp. 151470066-2]|jgi:hypothetical protein|uniref:Transmembrane protein n=2 Tax=Burkholderiaceae TaxID=119060 RepID=A0A192A7X4_9RALS|nr:hypothetical protein A9Y76_27990 [Ralstonia insidiosa]KMW47638.1 hypothetical protein AC240_08845 [Ralstonia sp. MD27]